MSDEHWATHERGASFASFASFDIIVFFFFANLEISAKE